MKRIIYSIVIAATVFCVGCKGFLDEKNKSYRTTEEFYGTAEGYDQLINACYASLRTIYSGTPDLFNSGTDLYSQSYSDGQVAKPLGDYSNLVPDNPDVEAFYTNCFLAIARANTAVYYSTRTEQTDVLSRQLAEARFLRAFFYFHLVQQFGGVAIIRDMFEGPVLSIPRDSEEDVYEFIITEMEDLIGDLPETYTKADYGRVNKRTVRFFLAKAYLTRGWLSFGTQNDFVMAKSYADQTINGQGLTLSFADAYKATGTGYRNAEVIWSVVYSANSISDPETGGNVQGALYATHYGSVFGHKAAQKGFLVNLYGHWVFTKHVADPNNDSRYRMTFMQYIYQTYNLAYTTPAATLANTEILYYYPVWWEPDYVVDNNTDASLRYPAWRAVNPTPRATTAVYPINRPPDPDVDLAAFQTASGPGSTGYLYVSSMTFQYVPFRKFDCPDSPISNVRAGTRDIDLARLNDAYLVAAEACFKMNQPAAAVPYINEVRKRAIAAGDAQREVVAGDVTIEFLMDERARELMGHYDRWYDLKRTGTLIDRAVKYNPDLQNNANKFKGPDGQNKILRPIPQSAIDQNKAGIQQNPGY